ncbi:unnamed protein product, partial [Adineta ricciae]
MFIYYLFSFNILSSWLLTVNGNECQFLSVCKCTNFPLFALIDTSYLTKPRSPLNQDLFCAYSNDQFNEKNLTIFEQFKYFYYRFRTLTFANYPILPAKAFRFVHFESQSVKQTHRANNRNVIALVNIERTESGIFEDLSLTDSHDQLIISFLNSPSLSYTPGALAKLNCYELKFLNTNSKISLDFFHQAQYIHHLIIHNPTFSGFVSSSNSLTVQISKLSIKDISVRHLQGRHFPLIFNSTYELTLQNYQVNGAFRSLNDRDLARCFPHLRSLKIYSRSIQHITARMFQHLTQLEYLILDGITAVENEAFASLYRLKQLDLGKDILRLDPYAFIHMNTDNLLLNQSYHFDLQDDKHFCTFVPFVPSTDLDTFVQFAKNLTDCSCTLRYLYRHLDKSLMSLTPNCYLNASLYILTQEERICHFEQRLLQCDILPDQGVTIYGKHYNVSY